jgi:hypothetical protein
MQNSRLVEIDPKSYLYKMTEDQIKNEANIATEIFIARQFSRVHYEDLMSSSSIPEGCASKNRLIAWINDYVRGKYKRMGVISRYKYERPEDFVDGIWQANSFGSFAQFMKDVLTDFKFTRNKKISDEFKRSFLSEEWYWEALSISGLKLLEDLYKHNALQTNIAKAYIRQVILSRELLSKVGLIIGRSTKNHDAGDIQQQLENVFEITFKNQLKAAFDIFKNYEEYKIYLKFRKPISNNLKMIYSETQVLKLRDK